MTTKSEEKKCGTCQQPSAVLVSWPSLETEVCQRCEAVLRMKGLEPNPDCLRALFGDPEGCQGAITYGPSHAGTGTMIAECQGHQGRLTDD